jgi:hypothetical protein
MAALGRIRGCYTETETLPVVPLMFSQKRSQYACCSLQLFGRAAGC